MAVSNPLVSVIIPCYKLAHYLHQAIDSVVAQTYSNVEVMVINDGSPDNVGEVVSRYRGDCRVRLIEQENCGVAAARNHGIAEARGAYVQLLDADDWIDPNKLTMQVALLESDPSTGLVYCDYVLVDDETQARKNYVPTDVMGPLEPDMFDHLWVENHVGYMTVLVRREWLERAGPIKTTPIAEDYELWMRLAAMGCRVRHHPDLFGFYRQHATNSSKDGHVLDRAIAARTEIARQFPERVGRAAHLATDAWMKLVDELREWIAQRSEALLWHHEQREKLEFELAQLHAWTSEQRTALEWHATHSALLEQALVERERQIAELSPREARSKGA